MATLSAPIPPFKFIALFAGHTDRGKSSSFNVSFLLFPGIVLTYGLI